MNQSTAVTITWILAAVLLAAVIAALYAASYAVRQRSRADAAERSLRVQEDELEHFASGTLPFVTETVRRADGVTELPTVGGPSRFGQLMQSVAERYAADLRQYAAEVRDQTRREADYEAQEAISRAEAEARAAARREMEASSREATSAAVRAFGTSVVSLGADVGQVVSAALREHRSDEVYATLTRIDHTVQQMIRQAQSYVIVCGGLPGRRWPQQTLTDVVGGAIGRVRDFTRVRPHQLDRVVVSRAVEPLVHTLATLVDNALRYSPPTSFVDITFQEGHHGVTIIIDDAGVRMNAEQMEEARQVLAGERVVDIHQLGPAPRVGFPGIAALARRYGFSVYIDGPNAYGGMRAMVYLPEVLLADQTALPENVVPAAVPAPAAVAAPAEPAPTAPAPAPAESAEETSTVHEITPGGLPRRRRRTVAVSTLSRGPRTDTPLSRAEIASADARLTRIAAAPPAADDPAFPRTDTALPRPDIAAAWHTGSQSGRAAAYETTEGMTS
ncbi:ATP-binding protein [Nocardia terpenica]|uniref:histidine kinase n=1 Tax=Nocardia terpenica TaxID=455432 RepID=A0A291RQP6_9NOCA|nr:sensor histidine kinase [Nocardia terpenica]ATL69568.1 ATP-binding protein [Nocardia terpenica]